MLLECAPDRDIIQFQVFATGTYVALGSIVSAKVRVQQLMTKSSKISAQLNLKRVSSKIIYQYSHSYP